MAVNKSRLFWSKSIVIDGIQVQTQVTDLVGRLRRVRECTDIAMLRDAASMERLYLQGTVRKAIERRIRRLERAA